jgi:hypothetical protein
VEMVLQTLNHHVVVLGKGNSAYRDCCYGVALLQRHYLLSPAASGHAA